MGKTALMRKYEAMIIVDARLSNEEKEATFKEAADVINRSGGHVINGQIWLEKHKLTFKLKKLNEGTYYLINFEDEGGALAKIRQSLTLNEKILRFTLINAE